MQWLAKGGLPGDRGTQFSRVVIGVAAMTLLILLGGCGGGGGGNGGGNQGVSMSVSPLTVNVSATSTQPAPQASIQVFLAGQQATQQIYLAGQYTPNGIQGITENPGSGSAAVVIQFKTPSSLGIGQYNDTVTISGCYDRACTQQVGNSPQTVRVQYQVTGSTLTLGSLSPSSAVASGPAFTLTVTGAGFTGQSVVLWNGSSRPTTFVSATELTVQISAVDIANAGSASVSVHDPASGTSAALTFNIQPATLSLVSVSPTSVTVGGPAFMLTVLGTGFTSSSTVQWNGAARQTTLVSGNELVAQISASDIAALGTASITVHDATSSVGTTAAQSVTIAPASIDAVAYQMNSGHTGSVTFNSVTLPTAASWSINVGGTPSYALIVNGIVYVAVSTGSGSSELLALHGSTGATVWGPIALSGSGRIAYDAGIIFVTGGSYLATIVSAIDAATGNPRWSASIADAIDGAPPVAANGFVYTVGDGDLQAFNELTGAQIWQGNFGGTDGTVAVTVDGVYGTSPCTAVAYRPATGAVIWSTNTGCSGGGGATPVVGSGRLYAPIAVSTYGGNVYDAESGSLLRAFSYSVPPAITSSSAYTLTGSTLQGVALSNNQVLWSFAGDGTLVTAPVVVNNYVFVGSSSGNLYALNATSGALQQTWKLGAAPTAVSGLAAGDGLLIVPAGNTVNAFVLSTSP